MPLDDAEDLGHLRSRDTRIFTSGSIEFRRFWWWFPWNVTYPWLPRIWKGGDEWCNEPLCFTIPPLGCFLFFWRPMRAMPCAECWDLYDEVSRADYLPGGMLEGGRYHPGRPAAWEKL